ncbi:MAG TPA: hypothetical protein DCY13_09200 [Verrucomicrobiales bacterium]|nr:hypothetical protein [Verrucomicrobiales bacterium]
MIKRTLCSLTAALVLAAQPSAGAATAPVLDWHFSGTEALTKSQPEALLVKSGQLQEWGSFSIQIKNQFNRHLPALLGLAGDNGTAVGSIIRPLLDDLQRFESAGHVEGERIPGASWVLAIRLNEDGISRWRGELFNLGRQLKLDEPAALSVKGVSGWKIPSTQQMRGFEFATAGDWLVAGDSFREGTKAAAWLQSLVREKRPVAALEEEWLKLDFNPAALGWPLATPVTGPISRVEASWSWQGADVRSQGTLTVASLGGVDDARWSTPKGIIRDPLVSFTAIRGMKSFLAGLEAFKGIDKAAMPDQWFSWAREDVVFINDFALPVRDEAAMFAHLERSVPAAYNDWIMSVSLGQWLSATNSSRILWRGLPVFVPYLEPIRDGEQGYLRGGVFPLIENEEGKPAPEQLYQQFEGRRQLLYYDWEITALRLGAFRQMQPFSQLISPTAPDREGANGGAWLAAIQNQLGNSITEATKEGENRVTFTRRSPLGMTGIELWLFTRWLDSSEFPEFPYAMPRPGQRTGLPVPDAGDGSTAAPAKRVRP